jgi:hypothetical protein
LPAGWGSNWGVWVVLVHMSSWRNHSHFFDHFIRINIIEIFL